MDKALISDVFIFEGVAYKDEPKNKPGVLRTVRGPVAEWDKKNRNGRVYTEKLWDKVLESSYVREQVRNKTLLGEGNHPQERFEVDYTRVSHAITEMYKVPEKKQVWAVIDILDTPLGNILNTLYKYGSVLGYSTRAGGRLVKRKDYTEVDEDTYHFITIDSVPYPSVVIARLVNEGVGFEDDSRVELSEEVHRELEKIIEESSKKDRDLLRSFIYELREYNLDREIDKLDSYLQEGKVLNDSGLESEDKSTLKDTTLYLLKESYALSSTLREDNLKLQEKVRDFESRSNTWKSLSELNESLQKQVSLLEEEKLSLVGKLAEAEEGSKKLRDTISEMEENQYDVDYLNEEIEMYKGEISSKETAVKLLKSENQKLNEQITSLNESIETLVSQEKIQEEQKVSKQVEVKEEVSPEDDLEFVRISGELTEVSKELGEVIKESHSWKGKYESLVESVGEKDSSIQSLVEKTELLSQEIGQLQESVVGLESKNKGLVKRLGSYQTSIKQYQKSIVDIVCGTYSVDPSEVVGKLNEGFDINDVHIICEEISNSRSSFVAEVAEEKSSDKNSRLHGVYSGSRRRG